MIMSANVRFSESDQRKQVADQADAVEDVGELPGERQARTERLGRPGFEHADAQRLLANRLTGATLADQPVVDEPSRVAPTK